MESEVRASPPLKGSRGPTATHHHYQIAPKNKLSVMVDTMDPVSTKHGTVMPPINTSMFRHNDIKLAISPPCEPEDSPPEL